MGRQRYRSRGLVHLPVGSRCHGHGGSDTRAREGGWGWGQLWRSPSGFEAHWVWWERRRRRRASTWRRAPTERRQRGASAEAQALRSVRGHRLHRGELPTHRRTPGSTARGRLPRGVPTLPGGGMPLALPLVPHGPGAGRHRRPARVGPAEGTGRGLPRRIRRGGTARTVRRVTGGRGQPVRIRTAGLSLPG